MDEQYALYEGDCLDILPLLPAGSVDAIIADPPYGTTACKWDSVIPFDRMWRELKRLIRPRGAIVLFGSQPFTSALIMSNPDMFRYDWIWRKNMCGHPGNAKIMPLRYHEHVLVFSKNTHTYNPIPSPRVSRASEIVCGRPVRSGGDKNRGTGAFLSVTRQYDRMTKGPESVIDIQSVPNGGGRKIHPTQKPVALLEYLVRTYTNAGDVVLDFVMGSGTTGHACANTDRRFIGIEKDASYFAGAVERIATAYAPLRHMEAARG